MTDKEKPHAPPAHPIATPPDERIPEKTPSGPPITKIYEPTETGHTIFTPVTPIKPFKP